MSMGGKLTWVGRLAQHAHPACRPVRRHALHAPGLCGVVLVGGMAPGPAPSDQGGGWRLRHRLPVADGPDRDRYRQPLPFGRRGRHGYRRRVRFGARGRTGRGPPPSGAAGRARADLDRAKNARRRPDQPEEQAGRPEAPRDHGDVAAVRKLPTRAAQGHVLAPVAGRF